MGSLPWLLGAELHNIPAVPYLRADPVRAVAWEARLPRRPRIGIIWAGNCPGCLAWSSTRSPKPPYLRADPARVLAWEAKLAVLPAQPRVGIAWTRQPTLCARSESIPAAKRDVGDARFRRDDRFVTGECPGHRPSHPAECHACAGSQS